MMGFQWENQRKSWGVLVAMLIPGGHQAIVSNGGMAGMESRGSGKGWLVV